MGEDDRDPLVRQRIAQERVPPTVATEAIALQKPSAHRARLRRVVRHDPARPRLLVTEPGWGIG